MGKRFIDTRRARLWRLADELIEVRFDPPTRLWEWQLDLMELQREIQARISEAKRSPGTAQAELNHLRQLRFTARHLGDAFAWILFRSDSKRIDSLRQNSQVPINPKVTTADEGSLAIIQEFMRAGWGFPVLHDITDALRIGDVTFINPQQTEHPYRTFELKASVVSQDRESGTTRLSMSVTEAWHESLGERNDPKWLPDVPAEKTIDLPNDGPSLPKQTRRPDRRIERQVRRMSQALHAQLAKDSAITQMPDRSYVMNLHHSTGRTIWPEIKVAIRKARRDGYADVITDDTAMFAVFYDPHGLKEDSFRNSEMLARLQMSGILKGTSVGPPQLLVGAIPPSPREHGLITPYFLLGMPKSWIKDMLYGRLAIATMYNPGRFAAEAVRAGFDLRHEPSKDGPGDYRLYAPAVTDNDNDEVSMVYPGMGRYMNESVLEMRGVAGFLAVLRSVTDVTDILGTFFLEHSKGS